jgi:hypothetical protein
MRRIHGLCRSRVGLGQARDRETFQDRHRSEPGSPQPPSIFDPMSALRPSPAWPRPRWHPLVGHGEWALYARFLWVQTPVDGSGDDQREWLVRRSGWCIEVTAPRAEEGREHAPPSPLVARGRSTAAGASLRPEDLEFTPWIELMSHNRLAIRGCPLVAEEQPIRILGRQARCYQGHDVAASWEIRWLEREQIPAWARRITSRHVTTLRCADLWSGPCSGSSAMAESKSSQPTQFPTHPGVPQNS